MANITFDLSQKGKSYETNRTLIMVTSTEKFKNYKCFEHINSSHHSHSKINFDIKCTNGDIIKVESSGLISENYKFTKIVFYFKNENNFNPLIFGVFLQPTGRTYGNLGQQGFYYLYRELTIRGNKSIVNLNDLTKIDQLKQSDLDLECKAVNTRIKIELNYRQGENNVLIQKRVGHIDSSSVKVNVKTEELYKNVGFVMYKYTLEGGFNKLGFKSTSYILDGLECLYINNINLKDIFFYHSIDDTQRKFPLLIEFNSKSNKHFLNHSNGASVSYELTSIIREEDDYELTKWICFYSKTIKNDVNNKLQSIYKNQDIKNKIEPVIDSNKNPTIVGTIVGVIVLISVPTGVLLCIYSKKLVSALKRR